jgi:NTE family protein
MTHPGQRPKPINLALQGGGAHGAFTWGVLDRLLEDGRFDFDGISGTSAGAMNAAALTVGWERGGAPEARTCLERFWRAVSEAGQAAEYFFKGPAAFFGGRDWRVMETSPGFLAFDVMTRFLSPYQFNPLNLNPLRDVVEATLDLRELRRCERIKLFVCATNVRNGKIRVFETGEITADVLLASACLPYLHQAIEIDGEAYWDGGYMGNPAIYPLIYGCQSHDVVLVQVNPIARPDIPKSAREIIDRITEISFNSTLMREMRAVAFVTRLIEEGTLRDSRYRKLHIHLIEAETDMAALGPSSKFDTDLLFLEELRDLGRAAASRWIAEHFDKVGRESSVDLRARFL